MDIQQPILVTGAASGLGQAVAEFLLSCGADIIALDKNNINTDKKYKKIITCDITEETSLGKMIDSLGPLDIPRACVNCAGVISAKKIEKLTPQEFNKIIDINVTSTFLLIKMLVDKLKDLKPLNADGERGVIINVSSVAAYEGQRGQTAYSASKGAIASMTLPLARELAPLGIRVMTIAPGVMETPMMKEVREDIRHQLISQVVFPKRLGEPLEFAKLVKHIIENPYLNGSVIRLDGGLRMT